MASSENNGYHMLESTIKEILDLINPSRNDWGIRFHIINEIRAIVGSIESLRGATVEPFGSFVSNLFSREGDLDMSIELQHGPYISSPGKKHKQSLLEDLHKAMRNGGGFPRIVLISRARVPILKFQSRFNISCDVSINNLCGQMKSKILYWINHIDGRFRDLVLLVKEWAKNHHINDPKNGTLNSYSLSLLVIFHFQTLVPAILPPLKEIYPANLSDSLTGVRAVAEKSIEDICEKNINRIKFDKSRLINRSSLSDLFISFLEKLSNISSRASIEGISTFAGQSDEIESNMRWLPKTYALFVEDPFEQPANTARTVSSKQLTKISEAIQTTQAMLFAVNQDRNSLVNVLVMPRVSSSFMRTPLQNPIMTQHVVPRVSSSFMRAPLQSPIMTQHVVPRVSSSFMRAPLQNPIMSQHVVARRPVHMSRPQRMLAPLAEHRKPQNGKIDNGQDGASDGPMPAPNSQRGQQKWRPRSASGVQIGSNG